MKRFPIWRVLPVVLLVAFYWQGLDTWFYQDDFGWLNVRRDIHGWADLLPALFAPKAHGNMRPLSETGFFTLFSALFGVDAMPFRIWVFLTQAVSLVLLGSVARRIAASSAAGFWAQIFWAANCGVAVVMCWTSIYNQALCGFFLLLAFWCLLRWIETGERRWELAHWAAFLAGFGALETNVVYPALAALYTWFAARKRLRGVLPMFGVSGLYLVLHFAAAPPPAGGVYAMHPDFSIAATFLTYWKLALGPEAPRRDTPARAVGGSNSGRAADGGRRAGGAANEGRVVRPGVVRHRPGALSAHAGTTSWTTTWLFRPSGWACWGDAESPRRGGQDGARGRAAGVCAVLYFGIFTSRVARGGTAGITTAAAPLKTWCLGWRRSIAPALPAPFCLRA